MQSNSLRKLARHAEHALYHLRYRTARDTVDTLRLRSPCLLLGSAPGAPPAYNFERHWSLVTVNASQACLPASQCVTPDLTIMSDAMLGSTKANQVAQRVLTGARTGCLVLINRAMEPSLAVHRLNTIGYAYKELICLDHWVRAKIIYEVLGEHLGVGEGGKKLSTGVFTLLLLIRSQVKPIVISGFSLVSDGHAYDNSGVQPRAHKDADSYALRLIGKKYHNLFVLEQATEGGFPLPVWPNRVLG